MADTGLPSLTAAAVLDGTELLYITQGGNSRKTTVGAVGGALPMTPSGAAGSGSFTPTNAAKALPLMGQMRVGGCYLFRFDDGGAWEIRWGFYTGSAITRPTNGFVTSSTGSALSLSANAVAAMLSPLGLFQRGMGEAIGLGVPINANSGMNAFAGGTLAISGTSAAGTFADTNQLTRQLKTQITSATTANSVSEARTPGALASVNGGFHFCGRLGVTQLPTAPRAAVGLTSSGSALAGEPSALTDVAMFAKDSTDTNLQFMVNDSSGAATKQDTSIALAINALYEASVWCDPAGATVYGLLANYTSQTLWYGSAASNLPTAATFLNTRLGAGLNGSDTGTAAILQFCGQYIQMGA
jgi:hypothetical protein